MSKCLILVAFSIVATFHFSAAKQAIQCGASTKLCRQLFLGCPPGETIEIQNAYHVQKQTRLNCHLYDATDYCDSTYLSRCCSNVTEHDSIVNFTSSEMASITLCDNKQNCSELILVNSMNLQVFEYHCKRDSTSTSANIETTSSLITDDTTTKICQVPIILSVVGVSAFLLGTFLTLLHCMKRMKNNPGSPNEEAMYVGNNQGEEGEEHYIYVS